MQTQTTEYFLKSALGQEADNIIRSCVHCGFCTATCPTYQLLGDERDGPRGRIYLIKQIIEGHSVSSKTQLHLDRCLSCRACETSCPSGVQYGRLVDIGRQLIEDKTTRPVISRIIRLILRKILPYPSRVTILLTIGRQLKPLLPQSLKRQIPGRQKTSTWPAYIPENSGQARKMLILEGCIQSVTTPNTNSTTANILRKLGITLIAPDKAGCCGAVSQHLSAQQEALNFMRRNIDAWWPYIEQGITAIIITASGCGAMVKEYGYHLKQDEHYADKAQKISELAKDISEILLQEELPLSRIKPSIKNIAFQSPCTLQHGQQLDGVVESILERCGFELSAVDDTHLCCGSAGTYSILQADLAQQLLYNKLTNLQRHQPELIVTANIGCQLHLQSQASIPVKHWIELLDESFV
ncbi:glycolate oxidase iron-sulfur subunit [Methylococcaceae bacterium HT2]|nr:glycolate oxidase iron-sulfur subunit [Methylococcaceae bacterium HT2]